MIDIDEEIEMNMEKSPVGAAIQKQNKDIVVENVEALDETETEWNKYTLSREVENERSEWITKKLVLYKIICNLI